MTNTERFDRLDAYIEEGRILRFRGADADEDGREHACLLVSLAPEVMDGDVDSCPASVLPEWLAHLTPALNDCVSEGAWPEIVREYARVVRIGASTLGDAGWRRVQAQFLLAVHAEAPSLEGENLAALRRLVRDGNEPSAVAWLAAWSARASGAERISGVVWTVWATDEEEEASWDRMARAMFAIIEAECAAAAS